MICSVILSSLKMLRYSVVRSVDVWRIHETQAVSPGRLERGACAKERPRDANRVT